MQIMKLCPSLLEKKRLRESASDLICLCNEIYKTISNHDYNSSSCFMSFLTTAIEHHMELVKKLFTDTRDVSISVMKKLILFAIKNSHLELVGVILNSCLSLDLLQKDVGPFPAILMTISDEEKRLKSGYSIIDCACLCYNRDIFKLLIAYERDQQRCPGCQRTKGSLSKLRRCHSGNECRAVGSNILNSVVMFMEDSHFRKMLILPEIVQLILDTGVNVNSLWVKRHTALGSLINKIYILIDGSVNITPEEGHMILETARILLAAGSVTWTRDIDSCLLFTLVKISFRISFTFLDSSLAVFCDNIFKFATTLTHVLLKHGALDECPQNTRRKLLRKILDATVDHIIEYREMKEVKASSRFNAVIKHITDGLAYFLVADEELMHYLEFSEMSDVVDKQNGEELFHFVFVYFAGLSAVCEHSNSLLGLMLNGLTASQLKQYKTRLIEHPTLVLSSHSYFFPRPVVHPDQVKEYTSRALEFVSAVEVPFSLQHLSRRAITRAMSYRCLDAQKISTLGLPKLFSESNRLLSRVD